MKVVKAENQLFYQKLKLLRYPLRLGFDAFLKQKIGEDRISRMLKMCTIFKLLMELYDVQDYQAFATSALREAKNGEDIVSLVKQKTGIDIQIISGSREAELLYHTHFADSLNPNKKYVYVDVGGGSTEVSLFSKGVILDTKSFQLGTVRILHQLVDDRQLEEMHDWVKRFAKRNVFWGIGSGGNINSLASLAGIKKKEPLTMEYIKKMYNEFQTKSIEQIMDEYSFKRDRADVILPALQIYCTVFSAANVKNIYVPKIGLADGMIRILAEKWFLNSDN